MSKHEFFRKNTDVFVFALVLGIALAIGITTWATTIGSNVSVSGTLSNTGTFTSTGAATFSSTITASALGKNMIITSDGSGLLISSSTPTAAYYLATSTTASVFPYASSTAISITSNLNMTNGGTNRILTLDNSGSVVASSTPTAANYLATSTTASVFPYASSTAISSTGGAWFGTTSGNVGIGTGAPNTTLEVVGTASTTNLRVGSGNSLAGLVSGYCTFPSTNIAATSSGYTVCTPSTSGLVRASDSILVMATSSLLSNFIIQSASSTAAETISLEIVNLGGVSLPNATSTSGQKLTERNSVNFWVFR